VCACGNVKFENEVQRVAEKSECSYKKQFWKKTVFCDEKKTHKKNVLFILGGQTITSLNYALCKQKLKTTLNLKN